MKISVGIPAYKSIFLKEAIDSVINQTYENWELVIVNDHSPYNVSEIVDGYHDDRIQYHINEKNCGAIDVVDNWNKCLSMATGDFILLMGDDDRLPKECLKNYVELIEDFPSLDVYHGRAVLIDEDNNPIYIQDDRPAIETLCEAIWQRMDGRQQFIGDYLFRVSTLKSERGFYKLPLAWGSDDITVFRAIKDKGIGNTNKISFFYRSNRYSITSSGYTDLKIATTFHHQSWLKDALKSVKPLDSDIVIRELALNRLENNFRKKRIHTIAEDMTSKGYYRIVKWLLRRKQINLSLKHIVYALVEAIKLRTAAINGK
jgi:glycosyltransferase involved in cell wall biosynthesis